MIEAGNLNERQKGSVMGECMKIDLERAELTGNNSSKAKIKLKNAEVETSERNVMIQKQNKDKVD